MVRLSDKKWNVTYRAILTLTVETHQGAGINDDLQLIISDPILLDFWVDRSIHTTINVGSFKFHNLNRGTSSLINQDKFVYIGKEYARDFNPSRIYVYAFYLGDKSGKYAQIKEVEPTKIYDANITKEQIIKESGIGVDNIEDSLIFSGIITEANTYRTSGATDVITEVTADDRALEMGLTEDLIQAGADLKQTIITKAKEAGYTKINIGDFTGKIPTQWLVADDEKAFSLIDRLTGGLAFTDLGTLNVLRNDETLADRFAYIELESTSSLLGTPQRTWGQLNADIIFSPEIKLAMRVRIDSRIDARWNGEYKVLGLQHRGSIGGGALNRVTTNITLLTSPLAYASSIILTGNEEENDVQLGGTVKGEQVSRLTVSGYDIYGVLAYIKKHHRAPQGNITSEITWGQAIQHENLTNGQYPTISDLEHLIKVCKLVQSWRGKFFKNGTFRVVSGWRSQYNNSRTKGAVANSTHLRGYAIDFYLSNYSNIQVANFLRKNYPGYAYAMLGNGGVHYDTCKRVVRSGRTQAIPIAGWSDL